MARTVQSRKALTNVQSGLTFFAPLTAGVVFLVAMFVQPAKTNGLAQARKPRDPKGTVDWRTGPDFDRAIVTNGLNIQWQGTPLRSAFESLGKSTGISFWIDRRVDPTRPLNLTGSKWSPLGTAIQALESVEGPNQPLQAVPLGDMIFIAERNVAYRIQREWMQFENSMTRDCDRATRQKLLKGCTLNEEKPFEPAEWVARVVARNRLGIDGLDKIPHDLWAARSLPEMPLYQCLGLVLSGFDLRLAFDSTGRLTVAETELEGNRDVVILIGDPMRELARENLELRDLAVAFEKHGERIMMLGRPEVVTEWLRGVAMDGRNTSPQGGSSQTTYTLHEKARRGTIFATIASQLGLKLDFPEECRGEMNEIIEINVEQGTIEQFLEAASAGSRLRWTIEEKALRIEFRK